MKRLFNLRQLFKLGQLRIRIQFLRTMSYSTLVSIPLLFAVAGHTPVIEAAEATLNMKDAELKTLIEVVSKLTGKTFVLDQRVNRSQKVTVISQHMMNEKEIYQVFLSVLKVHNMTAVKTGPVVKIIQEQQGKQDSVPVFTEDSEIEDSDRLITQVIKLDNIAAADVQTVLRPLIRQQGHLGVYKETNVIVITDYSANVKKLLTIVRQVDQASNEEIELIPLKHASASEIVRILEALNKRVQGKAADVSPPRVVADERTNSILLTANTNAKTRLLALIAKLDTPLGSNGNTQVKYLNYAQATELVDVLKGVGKSIEEEEKQKQGGGAGRRSSSGVAYSIDAHEATNSLVITAPPDLMSSFLDVINRLDIPRVQVHVEAIIVEITESKGKQLGVQWLFGQPGGGSIPTGIINFANGAPGITSVAGAASLSLDQDNGSTSVTNADGVTTTTDNTTTGDNGAALATLLSGLAGAGVGFGKEGSNFSYAGFLNALANDADINILSTPSVTTLDNEEASMVVGQEVPITTGSQLGDNNANPFQTTERREVGVKLTVTPQVNSGTAIRFSIEQEVSSLVGGGGQIFNTRKITTSVMVNDGGMVVLGGLISDSVRTSSSKVPLLGDIPYLGKLFRSDSSTTEKTNLMVFIRPTILKDESDVNNFSHTKYKYIRGLQLEERRKGATLTPDGMMPELPEWDEGLALPPSFEEVLKRREEEFGQEQD